MLRTPIPEIHTDRLILKGISPELIHELYTTLSQSEIEAFLGVDETGYLRFKAMHEEGLTQYRLTNFFFLLTLKETGEPIGDCGFHTWNTYHRRAEVYYGMRYESVKRKGYMKEAFAAVLKYGFEKLNIHRMEGLVASNNVASIKLLTSNGFTFLCTKREDYLVGNSFEDSDVYELISPKKTTE